MKEIALALGGGGIRGIAHIGVIRCLEENGFKICALAGTSVGGLVGSVYAAGYSIREVEEAARELNAHPSYRRSSHDMPSLLGVSGITKMLLSMLGDKKIEDFSIPFVATAVSVNSGKEIILNKGKAVDAVLSTIAIPGILPVQEIGGKILMDGGVLDPVPVKAARWLDPSLPIVAVVLHDKPENFNIKDAPIPLSEVIPSSVIGQISKLRVVEALIIFSRSVEVSTERLSELNLILDKPDIIVRPQVGHYNLLDKVDPDALINAGIQAIRPHIKQLEKACASHQALKRRLRFWSTSSRPRDWETLE